MLLHPLRDLLFVFDGAPDNFQIVLLADFFSGLIKSDGPGQYANLHAFRVPAAEVAFLYEIRIFIKSDRSIGTGFFTFAATVALAGNE
jgi:hypothetical protein